MVDAGSVPRASVEDHRVARLQHRAAAFMSIGVENLARASELWFTGMQIDRGPELTVAGDR